MRKTKNKVAVEKSGVAESHTKGVWLSVFTIKPKGGFSVFQLKDITDMLLRHEFMCDGWKFSPQRMSVFVLSESEQEAKELLDEEGAVLRRILN